MFLPEIYIPYIKDYCLHYSTIGITCDNCGEIIDGNCSDIFTSQDYFFECPVCKYNDWISVIDIAKTIRNNYLKSGINLDNRGLFLK